MANHADGSDAENPSRIAHWQPLIAACVGTFLLLVYTTIVTTALPDIKDDLAASYTMLQWVVDVFTVALAGLLLACGSLSDTLGRKRVYMFGVVLFGIATLSCGLAVNASMLVTSRAVQGFAGGAMFATILPLVGLSYSGADKAKALAVWGTVSGVASAAGTFAGGLIVEVAGWRWIFFSTLPICIAAAFLGQKYLTEGIRKHVRLDYPGMIAFSLGATALTYAVISGGEHGWTSPVAVGVLAVAALTAGAFILIERNTRHPLVPPDLFATRRLIGVTTIAFGYYFATFGALPVLSIWLQNNAGLSPLATSTVLAMQVLVFIAASSTISARLHAFPPSLTMGGGTLLIACGCATAALMLVSTTWVLLLPALVITGFGAGIVSPIFPAVAMAAVPSSYSGTAGAAANSARQLGLALGVAFCGGLFASYRSDAARAADGVVIVFGACAVVALGCALLGAWLLAGRTTPKESTPPANVDEGTDAVVFEDGSAHRWTTSPN